MSRYPRPSNARRSLAGCGACGGSKGEEKNKVAGPPWTLWEVPCRACSERAQQEIRWPLRCFTADITQTAIWSKISEGQRLQCYRCYHSSRAPKDTRLMMCGECGDLLRRSRFSAEMQKMWDTGALDAAMLCTQHKVPAAEPTKTEQVLSSSKRKQQTASTALCAQCWTTWPDSYFPIEEIKLNAESNLLTLRCWTCVLKIDHAARFAKCKNLRCRLCQRDTLTLCHFPPPLAREMLATHLRGRRKRSEDGKTKPWIVCTLRRRLAR